MNPRKKIILAIFIALVGMLLVSNALGAENKVPRDGTIYIGEADLDISDCGVRNGDELAWYSSGNPEGTPSARFRISDARRFTVDPATFRGNTGTWFTLMGKKSVFKVEEPFLQVELIENGIDRVPEAIKRGNLVSFKISTNLAAISQRPGSPGALVTLNLTGPNETVFRMLSSKRTNDFNLESVYVYTSPYDTGVAWDTTSEKEFPDGEYSLSASTTVNRIHELNPDIGATTTEKKIYYLGKTEEIPTPTPTATPTPDEKDANTTDDEKKSENSKKQDSAENRSEEKSDGENEDRQAENITPSPEQTEEIQPEVTDTIEPTPEPTIEETPQPTQEIEPRPTRTPFPRPPAPGEKSSTPASPLSPFFIFPACAVALLILTKRKE